MGYELTYDDSVITHISDITSEDKDFGARPVLRAIESTVEDFLTDQILDDKLDKKKTYKIFFEKNTLKID